jgi:hypothetical protein
VNARSFLVAFAALTCLGQAAHTAPIEPEPIGIPYSVGGCTIHLVRGEAVYDDCDFGRTFQAYNEARDYVRRISRENPNRGDSWHGRGAEPVGWRSQFSVMRIVSYPIEPGAIAVGVPLAEDDLVEDWENGHIDMRIAPPSRRCGNAQIVRWRIMHRLCTD